MTKQLLIYDQVVPVSNQKHLNWSVKMETDYQFAGNINSVPLMAVEFPYAAAEYAIVFAGNDTEIMPAVILGIAQGQNLYLTQSGSWQAKYIPAFIRRYPFVFAGSDDGNTFTLCIDQGFTGWNQEGQGERLFDDQGEQTQYLKNVLNFLQKYQAQFQRTKTFCKNLKELNLLEPMQAQFKLGNGEQKSIGGFMAVNRDRLKSLSADQLHNLAQTDELELIYLHLQSMRNLGAIPNIT